MIYFEISKSIRQGEINSEVNVGEAALELMVNHLARHAALDEEDKVAIMLLPFERRSFDAKRYLIREGGPADHHVMLLSGFTQRSRLTVSGGRQVIAIQMPGEAISCSTLFFDVADHSTQALTAIETIAIPRDIFRDIVTSRPAINTALLKVTLLECSISSEWLLNMGRRAAKVRVAHLFCEFATRMDAAGLSEQGWYEIPLTQEQIGDILGLTTIHVNRMLRELTEDGLIEREGRCVSFPDRRRLERTAEFSRRYLHI